MREQSLVPCKLLCWSLNGKDGKMRPPACPECFQPARVDLDMIGRPCYWHEKTPAFPLVKPKKGKKRVKP